MAGYKQVSHGPIVWIPALYPVVMGGCGEIEEGGGGDLLVTY